MTKIKTLFVGLTVALASSLTAISAYAQNNHSWVSSTGSGSTCTRTVPCASLGAAYTVTNPGGVISVLDPFDSSPFGLLIQKSLTVRAEGVDGGATFTSGGGFWIVVAVGPNDVVTLEGLQLNGLGGIWFERGGGHLHVVRCVITNGNTSGNAGITFQPSSASRLSVTDTVITNMGSGTGGGIVINPQSGGSAQVGLERVTVNGNAFWVPEPAAAS